MTFQGSAIHIFVVNQISLNYCYYVLEIKLIKNTCILFITIISNIYKKGGDHKICKILSRVTIFDFISVRNDASRYWWITNIINHITMQAFSSLLFVKIDYTMHIVPLFINKQNDNKARLLLFHLLMNTRTASRTHLQYRHVFDKRKFSLKLDLSQFILFSLELGSYAAREKLIDIYIDIYQQHRQSSV